jgi:hypothetical protein
MIPFTIFGGGGVGAAYASTGGWLNGQYSNQSHPIRSDLSFLLPWHWNIWK